MPRIAAERTYPVRRAFRRVANWIGDHRLTAHLTGPFIASAATAATSGIMMQRANVMRDAFPAETLMGLPPSVHVAILTATEVGVAVFMGLEILAIALGSRRLREMNIPIPAAPDPVIGRIAELGTILGREADYLAKPLDQRIDEAEAARVQIEGFFPVLPPEEQKLAVEFIERINQSIAREQSQAAAQPPIVPPPVVPPAGPYRSSGGASIPPPPPGWTADPTVHSVLPPPPPGSIVPTPPGAAASLPPPSAAAVPTPAPIMMPVVPPAVFAPPPAPPAAKEPSILVKAGRAIARGAARVVGRGGRMPPPPPGARKPMLDEEFQRAMGAIEIVRRTGENKQRSLDVLLDIKTKKRLDPEQLQAVDALIAELQNLIQVEAEMNQSADPALKQKLEEALRKGKANVDRLGNEASVAIMAGQMGKSKDEATVVIQGVDQQMAAMWSEMQKLLAGEPKDSVNETRAIMAGELWESAPTVNIDQKLARAFMAFIKKAKPANPVYLGYIERYFQSGYYKVLLTLLEKRSVLEKLGIAESERRYRELLQLLENYTAGSGGN